jgi:hypothetical protein
VAAAADAIARHAVITAASVLWRARPSSVGEFHKNRQLRIEGLARSEVQLDGELLSVHRPVIAATRNHCGQNPAWHILSVGAQQTGQVGHILEVLQVLHSVEHTFEVGT